MPEKQPFQSVGEQSCAPLIALFGDTWINPLAVQAVQRSNSEGYCRVVLTSGYVLTVNMREGRDPGYVNGVQEFTKRLQEVLAAPQSDPSSPAAKVG